MQPVALLARASSTTARTTSPAACRRTSASPASACTSRSRRRDYYDEVIVFLGATYFRAVGRDQVFGLSARGLAIDTALAARRGVPLLHASSGWCSPAAERAGADALRAARQPRASPAPTASSSTPGEQTAVEVESRLFLRERGREARHRARSPACSSTARTRAAGSTTSAPRCTTPTACWSHFAQRRVALAAARQPERAAREQLRGRRRRAASAWSSATATSTTTRTWRRAPSCGRAPGSTPRGDWGAGRVELVEIPTNDGHQRQHRRLLGARRRPAARRQRCDFAYTLALVRRRTRSRPPGGRAACDAARPRHGRGRASASSSTSPARSSARSRRRHRAARRGDGRRRRTTRPSCSSSTSVKNPVTGGWRLSFQVRPQAQRAGRAARLPRPGRRRADRDLVVPDRAVTIVHERARRRARRPAPSRCSRCRAERLLQDWTAGARARALAYLEALGVDAAASAPALARDARSSARVARARWRREQRRGRRDAARAARDRARPLRRAAARRSRATPSSPGASLARSLAGAEARRRAARRGVAATARFCSMPRSARRMVPERIERRSSAACWMRRDGAADRRAPAAVRRRCGSPLPVAAPPPLAARAAGARSRASVASGFMANVLPHQGGTLLEVADRRSSSARCSAGSRSASGPRCSASSRCCVRRRRDRHHPTPERGAERADRAAGARPRS